MSSCTADSGISIREPVAHFVPQRRNIPPLQHERPKGARQKGPMEQQQSGPFGCRSGRALSQVEGTPKTAMTQAETKDLAPLRLGSSSLSRPSLVPYRVPQCSFCEHLTDCVTRRQAKSPAIAPASRQSCHRGPRSGATTGHRLPHHLSHTITVPPSWGRDRTGNPMVTRPSHNNGPRDILNP